jgi:type 1 fimbriae regulatory protein FimB/type 1 fimbriae regulatory protein FimE
MASSEMRGILSQTIRRPISILTRQHFKDAAGLTAQSTTGSLVDTNKGHDTRALQAYLGHKNIQHTVRYTELSPTRFKDFWRD